MKTKPVVIHVKQGHIDRGLYCKIDGCALAVAVEEALPLCECLALHACVRIKQIGTSWSEDSVLVTNPTKATEFVYAFDGWKAPVRRNPRPEPISFTLDIPECFLPAEPERSKVVEPARELQSVET